MKNKKNIIKLTILIFSLFLFSACSTAIEPEINDNELMPEQENELLFENLYSEGYNQALIKTNHGDILVSLYGDLSINTVNNFLKLASDGFYDGTKFHRVISDFMIQGGDPNTKGDNEQSYGTGGPGYTFDDEINEKPLKKASLAMANSGPNTNGSQFFIVTAESTPWLDGYHTNFGEVISGMDVVLAIESLETNHRDLPLQDVIIESIEIRKE